MDSSNFLVQAQYPFKGSNNDELCFEKGDIITLTQREEGGWWEGTLGNTTGWFPSNYVKEYIGPAVIAETIRPVEEIHASRLYVFKDLLESEKAHVAELKGMVENFLNPLEKSQILTVEEFGQLICNILEVVELHEDFLNDLEQTNDRVGKVFLSKAPTMKKVHQKYCTAHPKAIVVIEKYKDDLGLFMEHQGASKQGILVLTTGLSKPFRRLEKYPAILQELERHMETTNADRGDTQRSIAVYKELASSCSAIRRQKELELQILTGPIRGWQGQDLTTMGDIIHMGSVAVGSEHKDRYFVLFPQTLLILSVSHRMSAFKYEGKLPITGITVNRLEDTEVFKNAFEIVGPLIERIVAVCQEANEANKWVELLHANIEPAELKRNVSSSAINVPTPPPHCNQFTIGRSHPSRQTTISMQSQHKRSQSFNHHLSYNQVQQTRPSGVKTSPPKAWKTTNLRPAPPHRPQLSNAITGNASSRKTSPTYEEDALVLRVIEAYCAAYQSTSRNTVHTALQPWTPCLPIRGGKLKTSKYFSSSNPQLPFTCSSLSSYLNATNAGNANQSTSSINSSHIWREATPNNFNLYSSSIPSLNTSPYRSRYSICGYGESSNWRSHSEEKPCKHAAVPPSTNRAARLERSGSNYDNIFMNTNANTPLLTRNSKQETVWRNTQPNRAKRADLENQPATLYDRRLNRSFETAPGIERNSKISHLRRSTPQLNGDNEDEDGEEAGSCIRMHRDEMMRNSVTSTWCCGNFVLKQWRKINHYQ